MTDPRYSESQRRQMWTNLARIRAIPAVPKGRHILVDTASARLWMYEDGRPVDSMKVVVGKPELQTPMMAGFVRYAILNPYWNVPEDLVRTNIAMNVAEHGLRYLKNGGYQVLSDWTDSPAVLDPAQFDWQAIRENRVPTPRVRQLPGGSNFMGKVKFMFPNNVGIYMHDTPDKQLLRLDQRQLSSGCVRLEDAGRMHRWLMGAALPAKVERAEMRVALPEMVPIYITHLTAMAENGQIAFRADPYGRDDTVQLAASDAAMRTNRP
jgi:murein L,D-transpeptidase YcbB/YkuD